MICIEKPYLTSYRAIVMYHNAGVIARFANGQRKGLIGFVEQDYISFVVGAKGMAEEFVWA